VDWQAVGVVDETIEDGIGKRGVTADDFVPLLDRNLARDQNRRALMAVFEDFEKIALLGFRELRKTPVVENQELDARQGLEKPGMASIATGQRQCLEQSWNALVENAFAIPARLVAESASNPAFPDAGRSRDQKSFGPVDPVAGHQLLENRAVDTARRA
jgi:hypothetical protein